MPERSEQIGVSRRLRISTATACLLLGVLVVRLWYLQCVYGAYYRDQSENNRTRTVRTIPPRGMIFDREDRVLVRNRPAFDIALMLEDTPSVDESLRKIAELTNRDFDQLKKQFLSRPRGRHFEPQVVLADVSWEELAKIKVNTYRLPGVIARAVPAREYPDFTLAAQALGYAREISRAQLEAIQSSGRDDVKTGDVIGQSGIEKQLDDQLKGKAGYVQVEVDARGNRRGELGIVDDTPGNDVVLTIDKDLQAVAEKGLGGRKGAAVVLDPNNGEVLALASSPSVDANFFSGKMGAEDWEKILGDRSKPLSNRAIGSRYPPGSTFKLFMAAAGLAAKKVNANTEVNCPGYFMLGNHAYKCHKHSGHGVVNMAKAIMVSCNAYFYTLGQELQIGLIEKYASYFGFGRQSGIELLGEDTGTLPSEPWKQKLYKSKWYPGDTIPVSIGQGYLTVTPMQMARAVSALATGVLRKPTIIRKIINSKTGEVTQPPLDPGEKLPIDPASLATIRQFAIGVVNEKQGTGKKAALPGITVAGKTGTAQAVALGRESLGENFKDHAWFIAFAPAEDPKIALAIIVENSGHGGEFAAPISHDIMLSYFQKIGMIPKEDPAVADGQAANPSNPSPPATTAAANGRDSDEPVDWNGPAEEEENTNSGPDLNPVQGEE